MVELKTAEQLLNEPMLVPEPYVGSQWEVLTDETINQKSGSYWVPSYRLSEDWFSHMSEKNEVDIGDFAYAFKNARERKAAKEHNKSLEQRR